MIENLTQSWKIYWENYPAQMLAISMAILSTIGLTITVLLPKTIDKLKSWFKQKGGKK